MPESLSPPTVAQLEGYPAPAGGRSARIEIAGLAVEFHGLPEDLADRMTAAYGPWLGPATGAGGALIIQVSAAPLEYFIPPGFARGWEVYRMVTAFEEGVFRSASYRLASWFDVARGRGRMVIARGDLDPAPRALENFLRSAMAWLALERGGFFLHGASIVRAGRCYLFYGPSGAGKSTLAAMNRVGRVISDDLTLLVESARGLQAAGGPFRGTYTRGEPVVGTFPVAGFYRLRKSDTTRVVPDDGGCFADLLGNLPFVVDQLPRHAALIDRVRARVEGLPLSYLHFEKDADIWAAIDRA